MPLITNSEIQKYYQMKPNFNGINSRNNGWWIRIGMGYM